MSTRLKLPDVSVVVIDSVAHDLARLALEDTLTCIEPAAVHVWSDRQIISGAELHKSSPRSLSDVSNILWYEVPGHITTSHFLVIQYDGWVLNASAWNADFLTYDYIGAHWPWHKINSVGNGGFSLRSTRLAQYLATDEGRKFFPLDSMMNEDDVLCRVYRDVLELDKFVWAPVEVAQQFSTERGHEKDTFGFHGIFNWRRLLPVEKLIERLAVANSYVRSKSEWQEVA